MQLSNLTHFEGDFSKTPTLKSCKILFSNYLTFYAKKGKKTFSYKITFKNGVGLRHQKCLKNEALFYPYLIKTLKPSVPINELSFDFTLKTNKLNWSKWISRSDQYGFSQIGLKWQNLKTENLKIKESHKK